MYKIKSFEKDDSGNIVAYKLDDGRTINSVDAFKMVREGEVEGFITGVNERGEKTIYCIK